MPHRAASCFGTRPQRPLLRPRPTARWGSTWRTRATLPTQEGPEEDAELPLSQHRAGNPGGGRGRPCPARSLRSAGTAGHCPHSPPRATAAGPPATTVAARARRRRAPRAQRNGAGRGGHEREHRARPLPLPFPLVRACVHARARAPRRDPFHRTKDFAGISARDLKWRRRARPPPPPFSPASTIEMGRAGADRAAPPPAFSRRP